MALLTDQRKAAANPRPSFDLARLIAPIDLRTFRHDHWERTPLLVHREDPEYYADLLTLRDTDQILALSSVRSGDLRVVANGRERPISELVSGGRGGSAVEALYEHYRSGYTVVINALQERWAPLQRLAQSLDAETGARIQVNVYATPAGNQGFKPHYDTHDVFIAQVNGSKRWKLFGAPVELPMDSQRYDKSAPEPTEPTREFDLRAGDLLYLPRGTIHAGAANDSASVHLTIGYHPVLWASVLLDAVKNIVTQDVRFRRSLPMGFADDQALRESAQATLTELTAVLNSRLSAAGMLTKAVTRAKSGTARVLRGHLMDLERLEAVDVNTPVRRRPEIPWHLTTDNEFVRLAFHDKTVQLPACVADELRFVAETNDAGLTGASIPGDLDATGRIVLIKTLVREGFLTLI